MRHLPTFSEKKLRICHEAGLMIIKDMVANEHFKRRSRHRISAQNILAGVSGCFFLLCDACPALESAGKHLEAYLQECRTDDRGDTIRALRLQALYRLSSHLAHPESNVLVCTKAEAAQALALCAEAYRLAATRYRKGEGSLRDVYETGLELFSCAAFYPELQDEANLRAPSAAHLSKLHRMLIDAAVAENNREDQLRIEILWFQRMKPDNQKARSYQAELVNLLQRRCHEGMISHWEVASAELALQEMSLFIPPADIDTVLQRMEARAKAAASLYRTLEQIAATSKVSNRRILEQLFRVRLHKQESEKTLILMRSYHTKISRTPTGEAQ